MKRLSGFIEWFDPSAFLLPLRSSDASNRCYLSSSNRETPQRPTAASDTSQRSLTTVPTANHNYFSSSWTNENERGHLSHGEFESPVWVATSMAIASDRDRDTNGAFTTEASVTIPGTAHGDRGGDLRTLLSCVAASTEASTLSRRQRISSRGCGSASQSLYDFSPANEPLLNVCAATIFGLAIVAAMRMRTHRSIGRAA